MNNIRQIRKRAGMTQAELASAVGCTPGAVCHYETGRRKVGSELCRVFIKAFEKHGLKVTFDDLFPPHAA